MASSGKGGRGKVIAIVVAIVVVIVAVVLTLLRLGVIGKGTGGSGKDSDVQMAAPEEQQVDPEEEFQRLEDEYEEVSFDEETGVAYLNNELVVIASMSASRSDLEALLAKEGGTIFDAMEDLGIYQVRFEDAMTYEELEALSEKLEASPLVDDAYPNPVSLVAEDTVGAVAVRAGEDEEVEELDPVYPDDDWNGDDWDTDSPNGENWGMEAVDAPEAWAYLDEMSEVNVGLIDGIPYAHHDDLEGANPTLYQVVTDLDAGSTGLYTVDPKEGDSSEHGTHVSGIMAATWGEGSDSGVSGILGNNCNLYFCSAYDMRNAAEVEYDEYTTPLNYFRSIRTLVMNGVCAINISQNTNRLLGYAASRGNQNAINHITAQANAITPMLKRLIQSDSYGEFVICVAAGNVNDSHFTEDTSATYGYSGGMIRDGVTSHVDAQYNNYLNFITDSTVRDCIICVGAMGYTYSGDDIRYSYSSFSDEGSRVDIVAPGENIYSSIVPYDYTSNGVTHHVSGHWECFDGTSMATPHVTGSAAMLFSLNPELTGAEVKQLLVTGGEGRVYFPDGNYAPRLNLGKAARMALETRETSVGHVTQSGAVIGLDLCFVVDTTGSMGDDIANAQENMLSILAQLGEKSHSYRVAIVDYRDFADRTGDSADYPSHVCLNFTSDDDEIIAAINSLELGYGGDEEETVYSGLNTALGLSWRPGARRVIIVLGDASPLDPEPYTGYTYSSAVQALYDADVAIDLASSDGRVLGEAAESLVTVYTVDTGYSSDAASYFSSISEATGGSYFGTDGSADVSAAITDSIDLIEMTETQDVTTEFGEDSAGESVSVYDADGEYLFTYELDDEGSFTVDDLAPGEYSWSIDELGKSGTLEIDEETGDASFGETKTTWKTPLLTTWRHHKGVVAGVCAGIVAIIAAIVALATSLARRRRMPMGELPPRRNANACPYCGEKIDGVSPFCPHCGNRLPGR